MNNTDPLKSSGPDQSLALFNKMNAEAAKGYSAAQVEDAALNVLVNAIRQAYGSGKLAEQRFDELMGKTKNLLMSHYDSYGKRKNIFPFTQYVRPPLVRMDDKF